MTETEQPREKMIEELLEILEKVLEQHRPYGSAQLATVRKARAIIAKAKGA